YCGHSALMGNVMREWQDVKYILGLFGKRTGEARKRENGKRKRISIGNLSYFIINGCPFFYIC
ncbi:MAG: hypothetical protein JW882_06940, partial [Deltaproteobacteria bacterium]|nr:hypothetical protein [Deltaproteobacteria bacterium]